jgi:hypothetical protein
MVEVKHESHYSWSNILLAHQTQQVYYLSYPHSSFKIGRLFTKFVSKYTLVNMMSMYKDMRMMTSIKKKLK